MPLRTLRVKCCSSFPHDSQPWTEQSRILLNCRGTIVFSDTVSRRAPSQAVLDRLQLPGGQSAGPVHCWLTFNRGNNATAFSRLIACRSVAESPTRVMPPAVVAMGTIG